MDPFSLAVWTSIAVNMKVYQPSAEAILKRYMTKFSKNGVIPDDHCGFVGADGQVDAAEDGGYYARYGEPAAAPAPTAAAESTALIATPPAENVVSESDD